MIESEGQGAEAPHAVPDEIDGSFDSEAVQGFGCASEHLVHGDFRGPARAKRPWWIKGDDRTAQAEEYRRKTALGHWCPCRCRRTRRFSRPSRVCAARIGLRTAIHGGTPSVETGCTETREVTGVARFPLLGESRDTRPALHALEVPLQGFGLDVHRGKLAVDVADVGDPFEGGTDEGLHVLIRRVIPEPVEYLGGGGETEAEA